MKNTGLLPLVLGCLVGLSSAYSASFYSKAGDADSTKLYIKSNIGSTEQLIETRFYLNEGGPNPQLLNNRTCSTGFNPSASTSFDWISSFPGGVYGTDTIIFGDPITQPGTKLRILNEDCDSDNNFISLRPKHGGDDFTFVGDFLVQQDNPVVVLTYKQIGQNGTLATSGVLYLAEMGTDVCTDDWSYMPAQKIDAYESWSLELQQFTYRKNFLSNSSKAMLSIDNYNIYVPEPYFTTLMKDLNVATDGFVRCNISSDQALIFNVGEYSIIIGPDAYLDQTSVATFGTCRTRIKVQDPTKDYFSLPFTIFRNYCLLLNYQTKEVGIAALVNGPSQSSASFIRTNNH